MRALPMSDGDLIRSIERCVDRLAGLYPMGILDRSVVRRALARYRREAERRGMYKEKLDLL